MSNIIKGKLVAINVSKIKGVSKTPVECGVLIENFGLEGDSHAGPGIRQVSLLSKESIENFKRNKGDVVGLCEGKFAENLTTEGICLYELPLGTVIRIGDARLKVSQIGKKCHADQGCEIAKKYGVCAMPKEGIFATVEKGGKIFPGDDIIAEI